MSYYHPNRYVYYNRSLSESQSDQPPRLPSPASFGLSNKQYNWFKKHPKLPPVYDHNHKLTKWLLYIIFCSLVLLILTIRGRVYIWAGFSIFVSLMAGVVLYYSIKMAGYDNYEKALNIYNREIEEYNRRRAIEEQRKAALLKELEERKKRFENDVQKQQIYLRTISNRFKSHKAVLPFTEKEWREMEWDRFEQEVASVYERLGYSTRLSGPGSDGGIDVYISKDGEVQYIQCKHYKPSNKLGVEELKAFYATCDADYKKGFIVCLSSLTPPAKEFYNKETVRQRLEYINITALMALDKRGRLPEKKNSETAWSEEFSQFINDNGFIDCDYSWLYPSFFTEREKAENQKKRLQHWKDFSYFIGTATEDSVGDVYYIIMARTQYELQKECSHIRLSDYANN